MLRVTSIPQQILSRFAERLCKDQLIQDRSLQPIYQRMCNKLLKIRLRQPNISWWLTFNPHAINFSHTEPAESADAEIILTIESLLKLKDPQQLMALLQNNAIEIQGDIKLIQSFAMLLELAHWDLTDYLTPYIGDVATHLLVTQTRYLETLFLKRKMQFQHDFNLALTEEWQLCVNPLMAVDLYENIEQLTARLSLLEQRIATLEHR